MRIVVKLFASLSEYLPPGSQKHQAEMDFPDGVTPAEVIEHLRVPPDKAHLVMLDGVYVPPHERATRKILEREVLAIFPPVAGG